MAKDHPTGNSGLYRAFLQLKTPEECYRFLQDVCSYSELSAMEQRYNIAELLADKCISSAGSRICLFWEQFSAPLRSLSISAAKNGPTRASRTR